MAVIVFLMILLTMTMFVSCEGMMNQSWFFEPDSDDVVLCNVKERLERGCSSEITDIRSEVQCVWVCGLDKSCIGTSVDQNGICFHHRECPMLSGCAEEESTEHSYMTKYCAHGTWDSLSKSCQCVDGFFGERCKNCHKTCGDLLNLDGISRGHYRIYIDPDHNGEKPFPVTCYVYPPTKQANVVGFRNMGERDFNRTWTDYVNGFYYNYHHAWIGLYAMHRLCQGKSSIQYAFTFMSRAKTPKVFRWYHGVTVSGEQDNYSLTFTTSQVGKSAIGTVPSGSFFGECLEPLQGVPFSTWDSPHHNDVSGGNCAAEAGSGWWFDGCDIPCNSLGDELKYIGVKPRPQVVSLLGVDMDTIAPEKFLFYMTII